MSHISEIKPREGSEIDETWYSGRVHRPCADMRQFGSITSPQLNHHIYYKTSSVTTEDGKEVYDPMEPDEDSEGYLRHGDFVKYQRYDGGDGSAQRGYRRRHDHNHDYAYRVIKQGSFGDAVDPSLEILNPIKPLSKPIRVCDAVPRAQLKHDITSSTERGPLCEPRSIFHSSFYGVRGNVLLTEGNWYYEMKIECSFMRQIGWVCPYEYWPTNSCYGVGDDEVSWAYDGNRRMKWGGGVDICTEYGRHDHRSRQRHHSEIPTFPTSSRTWRRDDVVGCAVSLQKEGTAMHFYLNGESLGLAFENFDIGRGICPAMSAGSKASIQHFIFEREYLKHLPPGYSPLQDVKTYICDFLKNESELPTDVINIIVQYFPV